MSNKETKVRVANAFRAMKAIGISGHKVKPVLKDLLKLYDKNWAYIEQENYRVLADTIFERDEAEAVERSMKNVDSEAAEHSKEIVHSEVGGSVFHKEDYLEEEGQATEEPERPLKRLRRKYRDGQTSSINAPESSVPSLPLVTPKEEPIELPETCLPNLSDGKSKGVQPISPQTPSREKSPVPESSSHDVCFKEPNIEPWVVLTPKRKSVPSHALIKPKDEPTTDDMPHFAVPIAVIYQDPPTEGNSWIGGGTIIEHEPSVLLSVCENEPSNKAELAMIRGQCSNIEIASSPFVDVKISLSCDLALGRPDFHMPNREKILRLVEEKCLRSYKILDTDFSMTNLMREMCRSNLKLGSDLSSEPPAAIYMTPTINSLNKSYATGSCVGSLDDLEAPCAVDGSHLKKMDGGDEHPETNSENEKNCAEEMNLSLVVYKKPNVTPEMMRSLHDVVDITNGQEDFVITLVNEVDDKCPPSFYYIPKNVVFKNAYVNFSLARIGNKNCCSTCSGDCLSQSTSPCACARASGGEFAYTPHGLVKEELLEECISMKRDPKKYCRFFCKECPQERAKGEENIEPCKGHLMRKFIKECWWKCGCDIQCGNRVVQRGISCNLQVFMTPEGKGWGLRTLVDLPKGAFVCEYVGEILTNAELYDRVLRCPKGEKHSYPVLLDADWGAEGVLKDDEALCLYATYYGNVGRFINHRCYDSNLVEIPVEVETPDHHYYHLAFFTTRKVKAMEELTWDYGIDFDDHDHPIKAFRCQCGSKFCRSMKRLKV